MKAGHVLEGPDEKTACCPLGHEWPSIVRIVCRGIIRREGNRSHPRFAHEVTPERCPQCGNHWSRYQNKETNNAQR